MEKIYQTVKEFCENYGGLYSLNKHSPVSFRVVLKDETIIGPSDYKDESFLDNPEIIGMELGGCVEGSDVEIEPEFIEFPANAEKLWETAQGIKEQIDFYWERDNISSFEVQAGEDLFYFDENDIILPLNIQELYRRWENELCDLDEGQSLQVTNNVIFTKLDKSDFIF